ncbi:uncharacterized protein [Primulina huaijiensis]|uniref:uncharacterized protein isoform X2 n=1 Tax=Primulina huaijiensis TaxID=1492673 RepID=UPI003CC73A14
MAKRSESERMGDAGEHISPSIPSSDGTVWADVSYLLDLACNARRKTKKKDLMKDRGKEYQIPPPVLLLQCYIYVAQGLMMMLASSRNQHKVFPCVGPFNNEQERNYRSRSFLCKCL